MCMLYNVGISICFLLFVVSFVVERKEYISGAFNIRASRSVVCAPKRQGIHMVSVSLIAHIMDKLGEADLFLCLYDSSAKTA